MKNKMAIKKNSQIMEHIHATIYIYTHTIAYGVPKKKKKKKQEQKQKNKRKPTQRWHIKSLKSIIYWKFLKFISNLKK